MIHVTLMEFIGPDNVTQYPMDPLELGFFKRFSETKAREGEKEEEWRQSHEELKVDRKIIQRNCMVLL